MGRAFSPIISAPESITEQQNVAFNDTPGPVFILGPAHSGKSGSVTVYFEKSESVIVLGTGTPQDAVTAQRLAQLKTQRPPHWASIDTGAALTSHLASQARNGSLVIDSLSQWLGEVLVCAMAKYDQIQMAQHCDQECNALFDALAALTPRRLILVSTEMGCSPPPQRDWTRLYRQKVGELNQRAASFSASVFIVNAGVPTQVK